MENFITPTAKTMINNNNDKFDIVNLTESKKPIIDSLVEGEFPSVPVKIGFDTYTLISIASITLMIVAIILIFKKYKK